MKYILFLILIFPYNSYSQNRVNKKPPIISQFVLGNLSSAKGWLYNPEGQWVSRQNRIPYFLPHSEKQFIDFEDYNLGIDNFISYEFREVKIKDSNYILFIKKYKDGDYKYESIQKGWRNYNSIDYYVFSKSDFDRLQNLKNDTINLVKIWILYHSQLKWTSLNTYILDIQKAIADDVDKYVDFGNTFYLTFHIAPYKSKDIVQFQIYTLYSKYDVVGGILNELKDVDAVSDGINKVMDVDSQKIYSKNILFKHCYYEVDYQNFNKFIKLN
jgi:hypothetical protein